MFSSVASSRVLACRAAQSNAFYIQGHVPQKTQFRGLIQNKKSSWFAPKVKKSNKPTVYSHVVQAGDPVLRQKAAAVAKDDISSKEIQSLIGQMKFVLETYDGIGLSAAQIGVPVQIVLLQCTKEQLSHWTEENIQKQGMEEIKLRVLINPTLKVLGKDKVEHRESCCSLHGYSAVVPRAKEVEVSYLNDSGVLETWLAKNWTARVLQHELDHLSGVLYTDKMKNETLMFNYWETVNRRNGKFKLGFSGISGIGYKLSPMSLFRVKQE